MNATKIIGIILIVLSLVLGYIGFNKVVDNTKQINVLGIVKIDADNENGKTQGYLYIGLAAVLFIGGIVSVNRK